MLIMKKLLVVSISLCSCLMMYGQKKMTTKKYIEMYKDLAIAEYIKTGVPPSITLGQGLLETGNGNSYLAQKAHNHFGVKWKKGYKSCLHKGSKYRLYASAEESFRDHSRVLRNGKRYAPLFNLDAFDYKGWAKGLRIAGYAEDPKYTGKVIAKVEDNNLTQYDREAILLSQTLALL